jgi:formylglycine-generating enzyme required for sulfatase activity
MKKVILVACIYMALGLYIRCESINSPLGIKLVRINSTDDKVVYIAATEITQNQWEQIMGSNPSSKKGAKLPVEKVSWIEVQEFCHRLSKIEGKLYRLPTASEWRLAAASGMPTDISNAAVTAKYAWSLDDKRQGAQEVATKEPSELGIYDMLGNVAEWCDDKSVRGGSFLRSVSACQAQDESPRHESFKSNDVGFRIVLEQPTGRP